MKPILVFTDLDGTLLNHDDYSYASAKPALTELNKRQIPLILVSSKTAPEMLELRQELGNSAPLVSENGSLVMIPEEQLAALGIEVDARTISEGYYYDYRGVPREHILQVLSELKSDYRFTGFAWMTTEEIVHVTGLSLAAAELASERKASEPILWRDAPEQLPEFIQRLEERKLRVLKGGRFYHVMGQCDKGDAVASLTKHYEHYYGETPHTIALGDSPNDLDMLNQVNTPIIVPHKDGTYMESDALKSARRAPEEGAAGWNRALLDVLAELGD